MTAAARALPDAPHDDEAVSHAGVTDDGCHGHSGEVNHISTDAGAQPRQGNNATMGEAPQPPELESQKRGEGRPARPDPLPLASCVDQIDRISSETDPIVRELCEAHRARKTYPAGHTFAMTNPIINGQMVTLGTCTCGDSFSYAWGSYERMDAAIEAHWQKFDSLPEKVDGRGNSISGEGPAIEVPEAAKPKRKTKSNPGAGGLSSPVVAGAPGPRPEPAPSTIPPGGAGSSLAEAAPIGAGDDPFWDSPLIKAALDLAWREPAPEDRIDS